MLTPIFGDRRSNNSVYDFDGHLVVVAPAKAPLVDSYGEKMIQRALSSRGLYCTWNREPYFFIGGTWEYYSRHQGLRSELTQLLSIVTLKDPDSTLEVALGGNFNPELTPAECLAECSALKFHSTIPAELAQSLTTAGKRDGVENAIGILRHPVVGTPEGFWIQDANHIVIPDETDYAHVRRLFSAFPLDPASHAAVHTFLFGAFHATSLSNPRPVLVVDSWTQGRGKSEVCSAISRLVDNNLGAIPGRATSDKELHDTFGARCRTSRSFTLDNVDGVREFNSTFIANCATGVLEFRPKYAAMNAQVHGALPMLNLVDGQATFHDDMLSRMVRCELAGKPGPLDPPPSEYAADNRSAIIAEILHALTHAKPREDLASSRSRVFDARACAAYAHAFGIDPEAAFEALQQSRRNAWAFSPKLSDYFHTVKGAEFKFSERAVARVSPAAAKQQDFSRLQGVPLLGYKIKESDWV